MSLKTMQWRRTSLARLFFPALASLGKYHARVMCDWYSPASCPRRRLEKLKDKCFQGLLKIMLDPDASSNQTSMIELACKDLYFYSGSDYSNTVEVYLLG